MTVSRSWCVAKRACSSKYLALPACGRPTSRCDGEPEHRDRHHEGGSGQQRNRDDERTVGAQRRRVVDQFVGKNRRDGGNSGEQNARLRVGELDLGPALIEQPHDVVLHMVRFNLI